VWIVIRVGDGALHMVPFWELRDSRIARDISIVLRNTSVAP
jgi:hypothetical protein